MQFRSARIPGIVIGCAFLATGCSYLPKVSSALPKWPQNSEMTPEETRVKREEELAVYRKNPPPPQATPAPQAAAAPKPEMNNAGGSVAPASVASRKFEVAPDIIAQAPPAPVRQQVAIATPAYTPQVAPAYVPNAPGASRYGDLVFVSGQLPLDGRGNPAPGDARIEDQARLAFENVRAVLETQRLTMANVVSLTVYLKDLNDLPVFDRVYATYFKGAQPARSVVEISRLPQNAKIEISAVAGR